MRFEFRSNVGVCLLLVAGCLLAPRPGYADKLMYLAFTGQGVANAELFVVEVTEVEGVITAGVPARLNGPLVEGGSVRIGVPLVAVPGDAIYLATQDDADVLELYRVSTDTPGVSTKLNPSIDKAVEAIEDLRSDFFAGGAVSRGKVFYTLRTLATGTLDLYVVDLDFPGVATQVNPDFGDGSEVKTFVVTPDGNNVVYVARLNSDADELFITSFASPGVATKLDGPPIGDDVAIEKLEVSPDGDKVGYVLNPTVAEQTGDLYVVDLDNPGDPKQVNADLAPGGLVIEWDFSPDSSQIAYRGTDSGMAAGRIYTVEVDDPGNATQISPEPAESAVGFFGVGVFMAYVDNGATLVYTSPLDHPDAPELYATSVLAPMTATKLNAPLAEMNPAPNGLVSAFVLNHNGMRMVYGEGLGGTSLVHVVDRVAPGVSVQPFGLAADQVFPFPFAIFSHESNLVASLVASSDPATG